MRFFTLNILFTNSQRRKRDPSFDSIHIEFLCNSDENVSVLLSHHIRRNETHLWVNTQSSCVNKKQHHVLFLQSSYSSHDKHLTVDFTPSSKYGFKIWTQVILTLPFYILCAFNVHISHLRNNNSPAFRTGLTHTHAHTHIHAVTLFLFVGTLKRCCAGACVCSAALMTLIKGLWPGTMQCLNMADHVFMSRIKTPTPAPPSANSTPHPPL